ncbi:uncharacterized protein L3040_006740 [Drepanopeziza brunnea f. sp. 'multigermtubi']|nr:hypothetical protein L3040_006740 [Drepanopeziza brunnea f. sp. 'multigermtubi']
MCSGIVFRFQGCDHAEEHKMQCMYIKEDFGPEAYCSIIRWLSIMHEDEHRRFLPGRCVECQNAIKEAYDRKTAEGKEARERKTGEEKSGEEKSGEEKSGEEKIEEEKTEEEKTGEGETEGINFEDKKDVEKRERRKKCVEERERMMKEVQDEIGFHF